MNDHRQLQRLFEQPSVLQDIPICEARLVMALRIAVVAESLGPDAPSLVAERLGGARQANDFSLVLAAMGEAWPEPFKVARPCCQKLSWDEQTCAVMFRYAALNDRARFDRLLAEMLDDDARNCIFAMMRQFAKSYLSPSN